MRDANNRHTSQPQPRSWKCAMCCVVCGAWRRVGYGLAGGLRAVWRGGGGCGGWYGRRWRAVARPLNWNLERAVSCQFGALGAPPSHWMAGAVGSRSAPSSQNPDAPGSALQCTAFPEPPEHEVLVPRHPVVLRAQAVWYPVPWLPQKGREPGTGRGWVTRAALCLSGLGIEILLDVGRTTSGHEMLLGGPPPPAAPTVSGGATAGGWWMPLRLWLAVVAGRRPQAAAVAAGCWPQQPGLWLLVCWPVFCLQIYMLHVPQKTAAAVCCE
jgi:hypothetical protein